MNCETFQTILQDLGRDYPLDLRMRQDGLAHAEGCPRCSARLNDECRLVAGLDALAASSEAAEAPPKVEEALLQAFRNRTIKQEVERQEETRRLMQVQPNRPLTRPSGTLSPGERAVIKKEILSPRPQRGRGEGGEGAGTAVCSLGSKLSPSFWNGWPVRVAAVSLLVMGLAAWFSWQTPNRKPEEVVERLKSPLPEGISRVPPSDALPTETATVPETTRARSRESKPGQRAAHKPAVQTARSQKPVKQSDPKRPEVEDYAALEQTEIATDFLPLRYEDPSSPSLEGGQLLRVQLPRATLLSFGFPMSEERAPEPIKADVFFGEDGMARAIRFVH